MDQISKLELSKGVNSCSHVSTELQIFWQHFQLKQFIIKKSQFKI